MIELDVMDEASVVVVCLVLLLWSITAGLVLLTTLVTSSLVIIIPPSLQSSTDEVPTNHMSQHNNKQTTQARVSGCVRIFPLPHSLVRSLVMRELSPFLFHNQSQGLVVSMVAYSVRITEDRVQFPAGPLLRMWCLTVARWRTRFDYVHSHLLLLLSRTFQGG